MYFIFLIGFNVAHRRRKQGKVGYQHRLGKEDAMNWFQTKVNVFIYYYFLILDWSKPQFFFITVWWNHFSWKEKLILIAMIINVIHQNIHKLFFQTVCFISWSKSTQIVLENTF